MPWEASLAPGSENEYQLIFDSPDDDVVTNFGSGRFFLQSAGYSEANVENAAAYLNANGLVPGQISTIAPGGMGLLIHPTDPPARIGDTIIWRDGSMIVAGSPPNPNDWTVVDEVRGAVSAVPQEMVMNFHTFNARQSFNLERWWAPPANPIPPRETQDTTPPREEQYTPRGDRVVKIEFDNGMV